MSAVLTLPAGPSFLEASRILRDFEGGRPAALYLGLSGTSEPFAPFLRAVAAGRGVSLAIRTPAFGTLGQAMLEPARPDEREAWLLFPWDLVPEADWRTGVARTGPELDGALQQARTTLGLLARRPDARILYVGAPVPPLGLGPMDTRRLAAGLIAAAVEAGADLVTPDCFSLSAYLASGCPLAGATLGGIASLVISRTLGPASPPGKVLVTDFDNTLWAGVLSEDGVDGIACQPSGRGYRHYVYQTYLARLEVEGILLAGVTRNSPEVIDGVFEHGSLAIGKQQLVAVLASYQPKSTQISALARRLNLAIDSMVFVDDNEVELAEVERALPGLHCVRFPDRDDGLPAFFDRLARLFERRELTAEDRERTALYRRRLEGMVPEQGTAADIRDFLEGLRMELTLTDRTSGDRTRAVQLINKTNQFNLNGRRWTDEEVGAILAAGGKLVCASLADRSGSHGEIIACLIGPDHVIESWVMSCRVFQRRVEYAFLAALHDRGIRPIACRAEPTDRNEPVRLFLSDPAFSANGKLVRFDGAAFRAAHAGDVALFEVRG